MKILSVFILLIVFPFISLSADEWKLKNISFQTENDADIRNDGDYTYGGSLGILFFRKDLNSSLLHIPFSDYKNSDNYISFNVAHRMYTPQNFESSKPIIDDRPYAGYLYLESSLHQSLDNTLQSLSLQVGIVGPSAKMKEIQKIIHTIIGSPEPQGWQYQLKDEMIVQMNYSQKKYYNLDNVFNYSSSIVPEFGVELGNASTKIYTSALFRWGKNVPKDYGTSVIDNTNYSKIPLNINEDEKNKKWRYYLNFGLKANLIARDIFLDGNTFKESHSIEKNNFTADCIYGLSFAYKEFGVDYIRKHSTKAFKDQDAYYSYGSLLLTYNY